MDRLLNHFCQNAPRPGLAFELSLEMEEDENEVRVRAEIPGIDPKRLHVELRDNVLTIQGEKKDEHEGEENGRRWSERTYGSFTRSVAVPTYVDSEKIKATCKDGVLTLTLPKAEEAKPKLIEVKVE